VRTQYSIFGCISSTPAWWFARRAIEKIHWERADSSPRPDYLEAQPLKNRIFFFAGGDVVSDSHFAWSGIGGALSQNLHEDGPRFRIAGSVGRYRYRTGAVAGGVNEGRVTSGELMIGFQRTYGPTIATAFIGAHVEDQKLAAPDPGHRAQGTSAGIKAALELFRRFGPETVATASASFSTVHRANQARATLAREHPFGISLGLEAALNDDTRYNEPRAGVFVQGRYGRTALALSGGYLSNSDKGSGAYSTLSLFAPY
jgi:hypothetical protein